MSTAFTGRVALIAPASAIADEVFDLSLIHI